MNFQSNDIVTDMKIHQKKGRREQILSSIRDSKKALEGNIGPETREYLEGYILELEEELKKIGMN